MTMWPGTDNVAGDRVTADRGLPSALRSDRAGPSLALARSPDYQIVWEQSGSVLDAFSNDATTRILDGVAENGLRIKRGVSALLVTSVHCKHLSDIAACC